MATTWDYTYGPEHANLPPVAFGTGLSPTRRWLSASLPADGQPLSGWLSQFGDILLPARDLTKPLVVATENGVPYAYSSGAAGEGLSIDIADPATMRTATIIARCNVGDLISGGSARLIRFGDTGVIQQNDADVATATGGVASLPALRGKWHVYSVSVPAVGTVGGNGVFVVDGNSTTFPYTDAAWNAAALRIASSSGSVGRQLRTVEIIGSPGTFNAAQLTALYAKAKAMYPGLAW